MRLGTTSLTGAFHDLDGDSSAHTGPGCETAVLTWS